MSGMMATTTLLAIVERLSELDEECTVYARKPWTCDSAATIAVEPQEGGIPREAVIEGLDYFIEVFIAQEFLGDWRPGGARPSLSEQCLRLIQYAIDDA